MKNSCNGNSNMYVILVHMYIVYLVYGDEVHVNTKVLWLCHMMCYQWVLPVFSSLHPWMDCKCSTWYFVLIPIQLHTYIHTSTLVILPIIIKTHDSVLSFGWSVGRSLGLPLVIFLCGWHMRCVEQKGSDPYFINIHICIYVYM